jgi:hypothetical protein
MRRTTSKVIINFLALVIASYFLFTSASEIFAQEFIGTRRPELTQTLSSLWSMLSATPWGLPTTATPQDPLQADGAKLTGTAAATTQQRVRRRRRSQVSS